MQEEWYKDFYTQSYMDIVGFASPEQTKREAAFVVDALKLDETSHICDLCCGYGRHTFAIAEASGCRVTGCDLSDDYLAIAKEKFASPKIEYKKADMREMGFTTAFDGVVNLFTSFGFFETDEENRRVLEQVNASLKPGGRFLLDYENKFFFVSNDVNKNAKTWRKIDENAYYLIENRYDVFTEREIFEARLIERGEVKAETGYSIRLYSYPEIHRMLNAAGFEVERTWGGYDGGEYSVSSKRLILLSRKR